MTHQNKYLLYGVIVGIAYFAGQHFADEKVVTKVEKEFVYLKDETKHEVRNVKTTKKPDGSVEILDTSTLDSFIQSKAEEKTKSEETKTTAPSVLIQGLAAYQDAHFIYGAAASKRILGPVTVGLFGFTDMRVGVSVGLEL